jgi:mRNA interferase YafQ
MSRDIVWTSQFKRDYKLAIKRGYDIALLDDCIRKLADGAKLTAKFRDHDLSGNWAGHRECHVQADWLLIYRIEDDDLILVLARTGTYSDLFYN